MKHKVVVGTSYGGLALTLECVKWLKDHGYSEEMVQEYLQDKVPRHDSTFVRCVEEVKNNGPYFRPDKFHSDGGYWENIEADVIEIDGDEYYIHVDGEGCEDLITPDMMIKIK